jgi:hypothetical protein
MKANKRLNRTAKAVAFFAKTRKKMHQHAAG